MKNPIYQYPLIYELALRVVYHVHYGERLRAVADLIPEGSSVTEICAGDCALYRYFLKKKPVDYLACDINERFLRWAEARGIPAMKLDLQSDPIPPADCVVMMGSLYQFIPHEKVILEKLIAASRKRFIIDEPVRNFSQSRFQLVQRVCRFFSSLDRDEFPQRFTFETMQPVLNQVGITDIRLTSGGRDICAYLIKDG